MIPTSKHRTALNFMSTMRAVERDMMIPTQCAHTYMCMGAYCIFRSHRTSQSRVHTSNLAAGSRFGWICAIAHTNVHALVCRCHTLTHTLMCTHTHTHVCTHHACLKWIAFFHKFCMHQVHSRCIHAGVPRTCSAAPAGMRV